MEGKKGRSTNWFTRLSRGKKIALCISGVIICLAASAGFYVTAKLGKVKREVIPKEKIVVNDLEEDVGVGYTNFADFLEWDSREGEMEKGTRTDCLIVASLNNETKKSGLCLCIVTAFFRSFRRNTSEMQCGVQLWWCRAGNQYAEYES